jgi:hypothetical protein
MKYITRKISVTIVLLIIYHGSFAQLSPLSIGTIHPNDSIVVIYDVTINTLPAGVIKIGNQGTVSGSNFSNIVTDDPDTGTPLDTTFTPVFNPIPVTLLNFSAARHSGNVQLKWSTSQELNSDHFEIQHSADGRNFTAIGNISAKGNSNTISEYSFIHINPLPGLNYYRLKQVDKDGKFVLTYVRYVNFNNSDLQEIYVYPNPVIHHNLTLQLNKVDKGMLTISLYNSLGQVLFSRLFDHNGTNNAVSFSLPGSVTKGVYNLQVQNNTVKLNKTVVVQ